MQREFRGLDISLSVAWRRLRVSFNGTDSRAEKLGAGCYRTGGWPVGFYWFPFPPRCCSIEAIARPRHTHTHTPILVHTQRLVVHWIRCEVGVVAGRKLEMNNCIQIFVGTSEKIKCNAAIALSQFVDVEISSFNAESMKLIQFNSSKFNWAQR